MALLFQVLLGWGHASRVFAFFNSALSSDNRDPAELCVSSQDEPALFLSVPIYRPNVSHIPSRYGVGASQHGREVICQEHLKQ
ncbi:hypothetical protein BJX62DRAFT_210821 [Aspergillus germanicus]